MLIEVVDDGPGVPEDIAERIFDPFITSKAKGTGLGLAIALRIMEEHGGELRLDNRPGEGATFTMTLPVPPWL